MAISTREKETHRLDCAGVPCLFQTGQKPNCSACGFCYKALKQNVVWLYHGKKSARFFELQQPTLFQQPLYV